PVWHGRQLCLDAVSKGRAGLRHYPCNCLYFSSSSSFVSRKSGFSKMQFEGQTSLHCGSSSAPTHSVQRRESITYGVPLVIASLGHTDGQASHSVQSWLINRAMATSAKIGSGFR